jgi:hypothetical protein
MEYAVDGRAFATSSFILNRPKKEVTVHGSTFKSDKLLLNNPCSHSQIGDRTPLRKEEAISNTVIEG